MAMTVIARSGVISRAGCSALRTPNPGPAADPDLVEA